MMEINRHLDELDQRIKHLEKSLQTEVCYRQLLMLAVGRLLTQLPEEEIDRYLKSSGNNPDHNLHAAITDLRRMVDHFRKV